jgi:hypothetical protein
MAHLVLKVAQVSSDDPVDIFGLSIFGALWQVAASEF